jgi:hypothetical protein
MKTIWRYIDRKGVLHMTTDIDEAEKAMRENQGIIGEVVHENC